MKNDDGGNEAAAHNEVLQEVNDARIEPLEAENRKLKEMLRLSGAREQIMGELQKAGARSPGLLFAQAVDDLQFGEDGKLENQAAIIDKLQRSFPEQFGAEHPAQIDGGAGNNAQRAYLSKEALSRMNPTEIAKLNWDDVKQVLSER